MKTLTRPLQRTGFTFLLALALGAAQHVPARAADNANEVVAKVGTTELRADEVRAMLASLDPREQAAIANDPALFSQTVRVLLARKAALKEALAKKWEQQPQVVAQLERVRETAIVESYLESMSKVPDGFPSDSDVTNAYEANKSAFLAPRTFRLAQIFVAAPKADKAAEEKARQKLDDVQKKLKARGADFAAISREASDNRAEAEQGGEIGWIAESQMVPDIRNQVSGLAKDGISDAIRLEDGWHIIKLIDTKPAGTKPLAEVKDQIIQGLRSERAQALRRVALGKILERNPPTVNEIALAKIMEKPAK